MGESAFPARSSSEYCRGRYLPPHGSSGLRKRATCEPVRDPAKKAPRVGWFRIVVSPRDTAFSARWWRKKWRTALVAGLGEVWQIAWTNFPSNTPPPIRLLLGDGGVDADDTGQTSSRRSTTHHHSFHPTLTLLGSPPRLRCYAALLLHNSPARSGHKQPLSPAGNQSCVRGSEKGIILLSGHNGVATRFRIIIGSAPSLSLAA
jgi:hypothetical protein